MGTSHKLTMPSRPIARVSSFRLSAIGVIRRAEPGTGSPIGRYVLRFQCHTVPPALPSTRFAPSGLNPTESIGPLRQWGMLTRRRWGGGRYVQLPRRTLVRAPVATFHNVTALSAPPLARIVPSGLSATE